MTPTEVEVILGRPPGDYTTCPVERRLQMMENSDDAREWVSDRVEITVFFREGKVIAADLYDVRPTEKSWLDRFLTWLGV